MGQAGVEALLKTTIETAEAIAAEKKADCIASLLTLRCPNRPFPRGGHQQDSHAGVQRPCLDTRMVLHAGRLLWPRNESAGDTACVTDVLAGEPKFGGWRTDWGSQKINVPGTCPSPAIFCAQ